MANLERRAGQLHVSSPQLVGVDSAFITSWNGDTQAGADGDGLAYRGREGAVR